VLDFLEVKINASAFSGEAETLIFAVGNADQVALTSVVANARPCLGKTCDVLDSLIFGESLLGQNLEIISLALLRETVTIGCIVIDCDTNLVDFTSLSLTSFSLSNAINSFHMMLIGLFL
jgi:hypothetical protein